MPAHTGHARQASAERLSSGAQLHCVLHSTCAGASSVQGHLRKGLCMGLQNMLSLPELGSSMVSPELWLGLPLC